MSDDEIEEIGEEEESCEDLYVVSILDRQSEDGHLQYHVQLRSNEEEWIDRSDLWDFSNNTKKIVAYDKVNPIQWDIECAHCGSDFRVKSEGCEECRCDECGVACRHLEGVNYGCNRHPVI